MDRRRGVRTRGDGKKLANLRGSEVCLKQPEVMGGGGEGGGVGFESTGFTQNRRLPRLHTRCKRSRRGPQS